MSPRGVPNHERWATGAAVYPAGRQWSPPGARQWPRVLADSQQAKGQSSHLWGQIALGSVLHPRGPLCPVTQMRRALASGSDAAPE